MATCKECLHHGICDEAGRMRWAYMEGETECSDFKDKTKYVEQKHGRWELTANDERTNYRWNVTAECSECHVDKGEIWAGFFPDFPKDLARHVAIQSAESVKLDNYCPNCGAKMDGV